MAPTATAAKLDLAAIEERTLAAAKRDLRKLSVDEQVSLLRLRAESLVTAKELAGLLAQSKRTKEPLRIKLGIDATGPELHLGHAVPLLIAQLFQRMGQQVVFIAGDFTATIGDPSGRVKERPPLTEKEAAANVKTYEQQAARFVEMADVEVRFNSEWLKKMPLSELFGYLRVQTVATAMQREDFRKRKSITRAELLYASLQAIDSVQIGADVEIGGNDQLLNFLDARELMGRLNLTPQVVLTTPLLPGTTGTGEKMSKSKRNFIAVTAAPASIYGALMAVHDKDVLTYFRLLTDLSAKDANAVAHALKSKAVNPKEVKQLMARLVTRLVHPSDKEVLAAQAAWEKTFSRHELPDRVPTLRVQRTKLKDLADLVTVLKAAPSRSEAKRLVSGGGVSVLNEQGVRRTVKTLDHVPTGSVLLQVGKRRFVRVTFS